MEWLTSDAGSASFPHKSQVEGVDIAVLLLLLSESGLRDGLPAFDTLSLYVASDTSTAELTQI